MAELPSLLDDARRRLAGAPRERLGELVPARRMLGIPRAARIVPRGDAWHLGVLLLTDDTVLATGEIVRARTEARRGYTAESQRQRAALAEAARRGGFAEGETVHVGWREASGILAVHDGVPVVRWSHSAGFVPLAGYLDERIELLQHPLPGAS